jgi:hypothetical protein
MSKECSKYWEEKRCIHGFGNLKEKDHLEDSGLD